MILRQGDVLLLRVKAVPATATPVAVEPSGLVLAFGEVTGHAHRISEAQSLRVFDFAAERYIQTLAPVLLRHEEHDPIQIPAGVWKQVYQVEDTGAWRRAVAD